MPHLRQSGADGVGVATFHLHAFGPLAAVALVAWSYGALRHRQLYPKGLEAWHLVLISGALLLYWALRLVLDFGFGVEAFPTR